MMANIGVHLDVIANFGHFPGNVFSVVVNLHEDMVIMVLLSTSVVPWLVGRWPSLFSFFFHMFFENQVVILL